MVRGTRYKAAQGLQTAVKPAVVYHLRLFRHGRSQAVRIPREFEIEGTEANMRKEGDRLIIEPVRTGGLLDLLARLQPLQEELPDIDAALAALDEVEV